MSEAVSLNVNEKATVSGGLFITPSPLSGRSGAGDPNLNFSIGGPEALWRDFGGGMGTHRASGDVKAGTD
jgi:hypothetical protein